MKFALVILPPLMIASLVSCKPLSPDVVSHDCTVSAVPANFTRIYIGTPAGDGRQSGTNADDPLDGTTAQKFDTILRTIAEGQHPTWGVQQNIAPENLIVCLGSGTFQTEGQFDQVINLGHTQGTERGFTAEKNWKIHGRGTNRTTLQLASFVPENFVDSNGSPFTGGSNVVIGTHSDDSSGIELSDLTIDANHDQLAGASGLPLNLAAIVLRSREGGHRIHNINVISASGDAGFRNIIYETFAVQIWGSSPIPNPQVSAGNLIENISVSKPGHTLTPGSPPGGTMDGIIINNARGEIRNNVVAGYFIAYGGFSLDRVWFHDNIAQDCSYGFNMDAFSNHGIIIQSNQFIHPIRYGIVMGSPVPGDTFDKWQVLNNTLQLNAAGSIGIVLRGQVQNSAFAGNTISLDGNPVSNLVAILSLSSGRGLENRSNTFQGNHIDKALTFNFSEDPTFNTDCRFLNRDLQGRSLQGLPDNSSAACR
jgi:hypothetical protein